MDLFFRRLIGILLIAAGIVCLWKPWSTSLEVVAEEPGAHVRFLGRALPADGSLHPDWTRIEPEMRRAIPRTADLLDGLTTPDEISVRGLRLVELPAGELLRLLPESDAETTELELVDGSTYVRLESLELPLAAALRDSYDDTVAAERDLLVRVLEVSPLRDPAGARVLTPEHLRASPPLLEFLHGQQSLERMVANMPRDFVPEAELAPLVDESGEPAASFVFDRRLYEVEPTSAPLRREQSVAGLATGLRLAGAVALIVGLVLAPALYRRRPRGIPIASPRLVFAADLVLLVFVALAWVPVVDALLGVFHETASLTPGEPLLLFTGVAVLAVALPWAAARNTVLLAQGLDVDDERIRLASWLGESTVAWSDVRSIDTSSRWILVGRVGWLIPRHYETRLVIQGPDETLSILEPTASTKGAILAALRRNAPEKWSGRLEEIADDWS